MILSYFTSNQIIKINLKEAIIFRLFSGDMHLVLGISLSCSFVTVSELFCCEFFETSVILLAIVLPVKSPILSVVS